MKAGRKRKPGPRKNGRLIVALDKGTERTQANRERWGAYYSTPIGRALASGLLGDEGVAIDRYNVLMRYKELKAAVFGRKAYRCPLDQTPRGQDYSPVFTERDREIRDAFNTLDGALEKSGCRSYVDQISSDDFTDAGPVWLDRLLSWGPNDPRDVMILNAAISGIDAMLSPRHAAPLIRCA